MAHHKIVVVKYHLNRSIETTENISGPKRIVVTDLTATRELRQYPSFKTSIHRKGCGQSAVIQVKSVVIG